ncbi:unnamed protein product [Adineta steineri]|nr:unnamed protein product [Adineta steineri]
MICNVRIFFQFTQDRYYFLIIKSSLINLYHASNLIPIENNRIIIKRRQWKKYFYKGNYSISIRTYINISNTIKNGLIRQIWSLKYRILFTNNYLFPYLPHSFYRSTFNINIITTDDIISYFPLNQINSLFDISYISFALLHQYECHTMDILQLCLPRNLFNDIDFYSYIFNYILNTIQIFETYFSRTFPLNKLTLITVLEFNDRIISKPGLVFIDQNILLTNISTKQILQQHESIFF